MSLIEVGSAVPDFDLVNQDGAPVTRDRFSGNYVLLWWYPKADTPGCTVEGKGFRDRIQDFTDNNTIVLGVSFDAPEDNRAFREKFDFPYDLLTDAEKSMSVAYGAAESDQARPSRASVLIGPDGRIAKAYGSVTPADHPDQVLADLASLG